MNPNQYLEPPHQDSLTPNNIQAVQETLHAAAPMPCGSSAHLIGLHASDHQGKEAHKQQWAWEYLKNKKFYMHAQFGTCQST